MTKNLNSELENNPAFKSEVYHSDSKLFPIAQRSKELPKEKFCNLLHHVTEQRIFDAITKIKRTSSSGPDGISQPLVLKHLGWMLPKKFKRNS